MAALCACGEDSAPCISASRCGDRCFPQLIMVGAPNVDTCAFALRLSGSTGCPRLGKGSKGARLSSRGRPELLGADGFGGGMRRHSSRGLLPSSAVETL